MRGKMCRSIGEPLDEQEADEEGRRAVADEADPGHNVVDHGVAADRLEDAKRDADQQADASADDGQDDGARQRCPDQARDRSAAQDVEAEVAVQHLPQPLQVLNVDRLVEAPRLGVCGDLGGRGPHPEHRAHLTARHEVEQQECDDRHDERDDNSLDQPPDQVTDHCFTPVPWAAWPATRRSRPSSVLTTGDRLPALGPCRQRCRQGASGSLHSAPTSSYFTTARFRDRPPCWRNASAAAGSGVPDYRASRS